MQFNTPPAKQSDNESDLRWSPKNEGHGPLVGTLVERFDEVESSFGTTGSVLRIQDAAGEIWTVMAFPTRLRECVTHFDPQPGDRVGVKYIGQVPTKNGRNMDEYGMSVERASAPVAAPVAPVAPVAPARRGPAPAPVDDEMPF